MNRQLQKIVDQTKLKFGLENYLLERHSIYKERNSEGEAFYQLTMEWFPKESVEPLEEDINPTGTAVIDYNIQKEIFERIIFVQKKSFSTRIDFVEKTVEEVAKWIEKESGLIYGTDFSLWEASRDGFEFHLKIEGVRISSTSMIEVDFDEEGKLIHYSIFGRVPEPRRVQKSEFMLTLEEIEPLVKQQLQLVNFPSEREKRFVPVYAMDEVFITVGDMRILSFLEGERFEVKVDEIVKWDRPSAIEFDHKEIPFLSEVTEEEAFGSWEVNEKLVVTNEQIAQSQKIVRDVLSSLQPTESEKWRFATIRRHEKFLEVVCLPNHSQNMLFKRKIIIFLHPETFAVLNTFDNEAMLGLFDSFEEAPKAVVTHEEAYEKILPSISLDPTYIFDVVTGKYVLCGLLDSSEGVNAVTGELISLQDL